MALIDILVGTVTGTAETLAHALSQRLVAAGHSTEFVETGRQPSLGRLWLICTANTGAGDLPPNILPFYLYLQNGCPYLGGQRYALVNLGDSCYANFAQAGRTLDEALQDLGATPLAPMLILDAISTQNPSADAMAWLATWETQV